MKAWLQMKKQNSWAAWKMMLLSLPRGIGAFIFAAAGLAVGMIGSAVIIGLPLLAFVLIVCRRMLEDEFARTNAWKNGSKQAGRMLTQESRKSDAQGARGWRKIWDVITDPRSWRGIVYCLLQLPAGAFFFALAVALPVSALAVMLAPAVWYIAGRWFEIERFGEGWIFEPVARQFGLASHESSWIVGGFGLLLILLLPVMIRTLGRFYAAWIEGFAGTGWDQHAAEIPITPAQPGSGPFGETAAVLSDESVHAPSAALLEFEHRINGETLHMEDSHADSMHPLTPGRTPS